MTRLTCDLSQTSTAFLDVWEHTVNATFPQRQDDERWWKSDIHYGINQGPLVLMVENYQTALIWDLLKKCAELREGLLIAGFRGDWLDHRQD